MADNIQKMCASTLTFELLGESGIHFWCWVRIIDFNHSEMYTYVFKTLVDWSNCLECKWLNEEGKFNRSRSFTFSFLNSRGLVLVEHVNYKFECNIKAQRAYLQSKLFVWMWTLGPLSGAIQDSFFFFVCFFPLYFKRKTAQRSNCTLWKFDQSYKHNHSHILCLIRIKIRRAASCTSIYKISTQRYKACDLFMKHFFLKERYSKLRKYLMWIVIFD